MVNVPTEVLNYIWLIPLFPLIGFVTIGLVGLKFFKGKTELVPSIIGCSSVFLSLVMSVLCVLALQRIEPDHEGVRVFTREVFSWIEMGAFRVPFKFQLDALSSVMILVVSGVGFLIHVYSHGYMHKDAGQYRFFSYMNLFTCAMLILVLGGNFLLMFIGWEGVGLCSYLLIGFWFEKDSASNAGKKAFVTNRIGDFGFALGMMLIFTTFGTLDYQTVFAEAPHTLEAGGAIVTLITLFLFIGATGKSAQIPLYVWLPDAMEGPTPTSALIHAATMVTSGVYMVSRCNVLYSMAPISLIVVGAVGAATAFFSATIGMAQYDIKKVLAYSTVSQLGYMFLGCGVASYTAGIFHLMTHAFFKALLFLGAGSVIHGMSGDQDMRNMGSLRHHMKHTWWTFMVAYVAIAGIPPFAGFFSKDEILWKAFTYNSPVLGPMWGKFLWAVGATAALMTAFYMTRLICLTFYGESRVSHEAEHHLHESPGSMIYPLMALAVLSLIGGWVGIPAALGGANHIHHFLAPVLDKAAHGASGAHAAATAGLAYAAEMASHGGGEEHSRGLELLMMAVSVGIAGVGMGVGYYFYIKNPNIPLLIQYELPRLHKTLLNKWYVDEIYNFAVVNGTKQFANLLCWFDAHIIDGIVNGTAFAARALSSGSILFDGGIVDGLVNLVAKIVEVCSGVLRRMQTGYVQNYALVMAIGVFVLLSIYVILR
ncbi:MAG: NADH-quinone oxidoreductase subunit L [Candidatus Abyssobacteria bacterium SURF_17]|uniref:NADH-quinone oxidoreductase subunit L n=1 Tax=Candidatus Abyssobacteria bacterium SURF_17 TaxID=2093361 RepID=A0A419EPS4_9BACT|nr:MAG: NADH-quinone oxidoreductase subunit L [Candidatus Abyssubacteria bacterium SURF_17]